MTSLPLPWLAVTGATQILQQGLDTSQSIAQAWDKQWLTIFDSTLYVAINQIAAIFAARALIFFIVQFGQQLVVEGDFTRSPQNLIWPIIVVCPLANNAHLLAVSTVSLCGVVHTLSNHVLEVTLVDVKVLDDVLPTPKGFTNISIHRCRAVYVPIALHYFCPANMAEQRLAQHLLGHVLLNDTTTGNASVTGHYYQYYLTRHVKPLTARGVKLAASGPIPLPPDELNAPIEPSPTDTQGALIVVDSRPAKTMSSPQVNGAGEGDPVWATISSQAATISTQAQTISAQAATIDRLARSGGGGAG